MLSGGDRARIGGKLAGGYYFQPAVLNGRNRMRVFEEIFGPVLANRSCRICGGGGHDQWGKH